MPNLVQETPSKRNMTVNFLRNKAFRFETRALVLGTFPQTISLILRRLRERFEPNFEPTGKMTL
jgi:hypothetical protein